MHRKAGKTVIKRLSK